MEKITYILGAGASIEAFPTIKPIDKYHNNRSFSEDIILLSKEANKSKKTLTSLSGEIQTLTDTLLMIGEKSKEFGNIDTYAKYLYHKGKSNELVRLKLALTFYFTWKQLVENKFDSRYRHFVTSIIDENHRFPQNVKILNWNYDFQLEIASSLYGTEKFFYYKGSSITSPGFINTYPSPGQEFILNHPDYEEDLAVIHLNGIAGFYVEEFPNSKDKNLTTRLFDSIFNDYAKEMDNQRTKGTRPSKKIFFSSFINKWNGHPKLLTFAWEKNSSTKKYLQNTMNLVKKNIKDTSILVIIGYSFPFYNREIDNEIFNSLKSLKKIYYQDPNINGEFLRKRYDLPNEIKEVFNEIHWPVEIEHISDCDQFYVPVEL